MRVPVVLIAVAFLTGGALAQSPSPDGQRDAYQRNLTACVTRARPCDRAALSASDRGYLTYEMGDQRFSARDAEDVVAVRMESYLQPPATVAGQVAPRNEQTEGTSLIIPVQARDCVVHVKEHVRADGSHVKEHIRRAPGC